jgi:hypothetical protein
VSAFLADAVAIADGFRRAADADPAAPHYKEQAALREALWRAGRGGVRDTALPPEWQCRGALGCSAATAVTVHPADSGGAGFGPAGQAFFHQCRVIHGHGLA